MKAGESKISNSTKEDLYLEEDLSEIIYQKKGLGWQDSLQQNIWEIYMDRFGFEDWWDQIDEDIKGDIESTIVAAICNFFEK